MLGKNQIQRLENLRNLEKLDVLDLHSNRIKEIQNIRPAVLPIFASTCQVRHPMGLESFVELVVSPSFQQSWKWTKGLPKRKVVFENPPVSFHDCWREGSLFWGSFWLRWWLAVVLVAIWSFFGFWWLAVFMASPTEKMTLRTVEPLRTLETIALLGCRLKPQSF